MGKYLWHHHKCWDANRRPRGHEQTVKRPTWSGEKGFWCVTDIAQSNQRWLRLAVAKRCEQTTTKALSWQKFSHASPQLCSAAWLLSAQFWFDSFIHTVTNPAGSLDPITRGNVIHLHFCKTTDKLNPDASLGCKLCVCLGWNFYLCLVTTLNLWSGQVQAQRRLGYN